MYARVALGEMADEGYPLACEADVNGAITLAILRACSLYEKPPFLADLTIRNPIHDNSELLWHCGPFPYSLKAEDRGRYDGRAGDQRNLRLSGSRRLETVGREADVWSIHSPSWLCIRLL